MSITIALLDSSTELDGDQLDDTISTLQLWLSSSPYSHQVRHLKLKVLSYARLQRYTLSRQTEDIHKAILHLTEVVLLPLPPLFDPDVCTHVISCFLLLARVLFHRFLVTSQPEDLKYSVDYFRHWRLYHYSDVRLDLVTVGAPRSQIIMEFIMALGTHIQVELKPACATASVTRTIEEMLPLCREILISGGNLVDAIVLS